jgi:bisphosphoglycerate-independent phosphoglycerate mutase (AlkP superfamily)
MTDTQISGAVVLVIIDGFGWRDGSKDNAVRLAYKPNYDALWEHGPRGFLRACGPEIGLGAGQVGDSEIGHRNIGAGRLVWKESPLEPEYLLGGVIAATGRTQLRIATQDKISQVTRFINGGYVAPFPGEARVVAQDVAAEAAAAILSRRYEFVLINLGDADLAGHTGDLEQAINAVEAVDAALGQVVEAVRAAGGAMLVTSDHGNCEMMRDPITGRPHTGHTANDVPVILMAPGDYFFRDGCLADVAPTVLKLMGLSQPAAMTGRSLSRRNTEMPEGWQEDSSKQFAI